MLFRSCSSLKFLPETIRRSLPTAACTHCLNSCSHRTHWLRSQRQHLSSCCKPGLQLHRPGHRNQPHFCCAIPNRHHHGSSAVAESLQHSMGRRTRAPPHSFSHLQVAADPRLPPKISAKLNKSETALQQASPRHSRTFARPPKNRGTSISPTIQSQYMSGRSAAW